jgi:hypothetical protein
MLRLGSVCLFGRWVVTWQWLESTRVQARVCGRGDAPTAISPRLAHIWRYDPSKLELVWKGGRVPLNKDGPGQTAKLSVIMPARTADVYRKAASTLGMSLSQLVREVDWIAGGLSDA